MARGLYADLDELALQLGVGDPFVDDLVLISYYVHH
jgi:hypothetical protein